MNPTVFTFCVTIASVQSAILDTAANTDNQITQQGHELDHQLYNRQQRFFSSVKLKTIDASNELDSPVSALEKIDEDPNTALSGVYSDCLMNLSFPCLQRKILVFLDRLGRMAKFDLIGNFLSVVRTAKETRPQLTENSLLARNIDDELTLRNMIDTSIDRFFDDHVFRVSLPSALGETARSSSVIDFRVGDYLEEGRGKKIKGGKMKGMKKMMMMGCMMMMGKAAMFGPMIMGVASLAAIKALIFSTIALTISKIIILKKLKMMMSKGDSSGWSSGGSGGAGWSSGGGGSSSGGWSSGGGGGGWSSGGGSDRSLDTHSIVYKAYR